MIIPIDGVGDVGIISDVAPYKLPYWAWTAGQNVRFRDGYVEKFLGHSAAFGTPSIAPYWATPTLTDATLYTWIYAGLAKVYAWNGASHANITRQTLGVDVDYSATALKNWTGGNFGGLPILNNSVDLPQVLSPPTSGTKLQNLPNWNVAWVAGALRPYREFLIALDVTKAGTNYPQMVKWSHRAEPLSYPTSWDETDPTVDAGEFSLTTSPGIILDGFPLRDDFIIYKEDEVWRMQDVGGLAIMAFKRIDGAPGMLSRRCAAAIPGGFHVVFGFNDLYKHDGQNFASIIEAKYRKALYSEIDSTNGKKSFVATNLDRQEVWFCYPTAGQSSPNKALVWNWSTNTVGFRDLPTVAHIENGVVDPGSSNAWSAQSQSWMSSSSAWGDRPYNPFKYKMLMCDPVDRKLYLVDDTNQFDAVSFTSYVERTDLGFPLGPQSAFGLREQDGSPRPPDYSSVRMIRRVWPRISGDTGNVVKVYVGTQSKLGGPVTYQTPQDFTIGTTESIACLASGKVHAIKFLSTGNFSWQLNGYDIDIVQVGKF